MFFCLPCRFYLGCHSGRQLTLQPQLVSTLMPRDLLQQNNSKWLIVCWQLLCFCFCFFFFFQGTAELNATFPPSKKVGIPGQFLCEMLRSSTIIRTCYVLITIANISMESSLNHTNNIVFIFSLLLCQIYNLLLCFCSGGRSIGNPAPHLSSINVSDVFVDAL